MTRLSIVLPTYNGAEELAQLLPRLRAQKVTGDFEILAIDSSSSDRTLALLREHSVDTVTIAKNEFRHGATRNRRARDAKGELLVFLSQDVLPEGENFLEELARAFDDPRVAGAYARVLPHPDDDPLTMRTVLDLPEASEMEHVRELPSASSLWELDAETRARYLRFNDVASAIRAEVFRAIPFPDLEFGEDFAWAARALTAGWRIRFHPSAVVRHAHRYTPRSVFARYKVDAEFHRSIHGYRVRPDLASAARGFFYEVREDVRFLKRRRGGLRYLLCSPPLRAAQVLGQYVGSRGARGL